MGGTSMRWVFLLALGLTILGSIQCPDTKAPPSPQRSNSALRRLSNVVKKLTRTRTGSSSKSGSSSDSDGSASDRDGMPASGRAGGGRLPRSRSPSHIGGGAGGWDGASSSGGGSSAGGINRMYSFVDRVPMFSQEINDRGAAHVVTNMRLSVFTGIINEMQQTARTDECRQNAGARGFQHGYQKCQEMYAEFKKIEPRYRGECNDAVLGACVKWTAGGREERKCSFFIQTGHRTATRLDGYYASLQDCIDAIKHQLFMDDELAGMGINPPTSPPKPLLPPHYSPEY